MKSFDLFLRKNWLFVLVWYGEDKLSKNLGRMEIKVKSFLQSFTLFHRDICRKLLFTTDSIFNILSAQRP